MTTLVSLIPKNTWYQINIGSCAAVMGGYIFDPGLLFTWVVLEDMRCSVDFEPYFLVSKIYCHEIIRTLNQIKSRYVEYVAAVSIIISPQAYVYLQWMLGIFLVNNYLSTIGYFWYGLQALITVFLNKSKIKERWLLNLLSFYLSFLEMIYKTQYWKHMRKWAQLWCTFSYRKIFYCW